MNIKRHIVDMDANKQSVTFLGDFSPIGADVQRIAASWRPFEQVKSILGGESTLIANLEAPLTHECSGRPFKWANLRAEPEISPALHGLDVAILANNHIADFGRVGVTETLETLDRVNISYCGYGHSIREASQPVFLDLSGKRLGLVGLCCPTTNSEQLATHDSEGVAPLSMRNIATSVLSVRNSCDALILYLHWGSEWSHDPVPDQMRLARYAIKCGADAVLGCHSHTIQSYEQYRGRWIFYGLGNFIFGQGEAIETLPNGETRRHRRRDDNAQRESLAVSFQITEDSGNGRLQLEKVQPLRCGEDLLLAPLVQSDLSFDLAGCCKTLRQYAERNAQQLEQEQEPKFQSFFRNDILAFDYASSSIGEGNSEIGSKIRSLRSTAKRVLRDVPVAKAANRLLLEWTDRSDRFVETKLTARIRRKWREDCKCLPLTSEHWELYQIIHRRLHGELGEFPELVHCRDFNDRIQWLKLFDQDIEIIRCTDKIRVREYVKVQLGHQYLPTLFQTCSHFYEINFDLLPQEFVIKTNHDSGTVILVRDKSCVDLQAMRNQVENSLRRTYGRENGEWSYAHIKPMILVEEFIDPSNYAPPPDYKFHVVEGKVRFLQFISQRGLNTKEQTISANGDDLDTHFDLNFTVAKTFVKPASWEEMKRVAEKLGREFKYVRVDLFELDERIYVGELTFWPYFGCYKGGGQRKLGQLLDFSRTTFKAPVYKLD